MKFLNKKNIPNSPKLSKEEIILVQEGIHEMLNKGAILDASIHLEGKFIGNIFLVQKNDEVKLNQ